MSVISIVLIISVIGFILWCAVSPAQKKADNTNARTAGNLMVPHGIPSETIQDLFVGSLWKQKVDNNEVAITTVELDKTKTHQPPLFIKPNELAKFIELTPIDKFSDFTMNGFKSNDEGSTFERVFSLKVEVATDKTAKISINNHIHQTLKYCREIALDLIRPTQLTIMFGQLMSIPITVESLDYLSIENTSEIRYLESSRAAKFVAKAAKIEIP